MSLKEYVAPERQDANVALTSAEACPVCGVELLQADVDEPEESYFCPYCTTRTLPRRL